MNRRAAVGLTVTALYLLAGPALADEAPPPRPKADPPPWAKVTLNAEIGGKPKKGEPTFGAGITMVPNGTVTMSWRGPTPPGTKRLSDETIETRETSCLLVLKLSAELSLSVWMEPTPADFERQLKRLEDNGEADGAENRQLARSSAIMFQKMRLEEGWPDVKPARLLFEGEVAAPTRKTELPSILALGRLQVVADLKDAVIPEPGGAWVEGRLEAGKFAIGGDKTSAWAIRNGTSPIALIGKGVEGAGDLKGDVRAVGRLLVGPDRQLLLEVAELKALKK